MSRRLETEAYGYGGWWELGRLSCCLRWLRAMAWPWRLLKEEKKKKKKPGVCEKPELVACNMGRRQQRQI